MMLMMVWWILVIAAIVWLLVEFGRRTQFTTAGPGAAQRILEERFARGEIDAEEFQARQAAIAAADR